MLTLKKGIEVTLVFVLHYGEVQSFKPSFDEIVNSYHNHVPIFLSGSEFHILVNRYDVDVRQLECTEETVITVTGTLV